jgi:hypothetical protein
MGHRLSGEGVLVSGGLLVVEEMLDSACSWREGVVRGLGKK